MGRTYKTWIVLLQAFRHSWCGVSHPKTLTSRIKYLCYLFSQSQTLSSTHYSLQNVFQGGHYGSSKVYIAFRTGDTTLGWTPQSNSPGPDGVSLWGCSKAYVGESIVYNLLAFFRIPDDVDEASKRTPTRRNFHCQLLIDCRHSIRYQVLISKLSYRCLARSKAFPSLMI
jgi:hypothetical protein